MVGLLWLNSAIAIICPLCLLGSEGGTSLLHSAVLGSESWPYSDIRMPLAKAWLASGLALGTPWDTPLPRIPSLPSSRTNTGRICGNFQVPQCAPTMISRCYLGCSQQFLEARNNIRHIPLSWLVYKSQFQLTVLARAIVESTLSRVPCQNGRQKGPVELAEFKTTASIEKTLENESGPTYDTKQTKNLLRKIDRHLIPFLSLLYLLSFLEWVLPNFRIFKRS